MAITLAMKKEERERRERENKTKVKDKAAKQLEEKCRKGRDEERAKGEHGWCQRCLRGLPASPSAATSSCVVAIF